MHFYKMYLLLMIYIIQMKSIEIAFVGSVSAGKTSLVKRCMGEGFEQNSTKPTLGAQFHSTTIVIGKETYKCNFVDSQGFDNNRGITMIPQYKRYHGFIVVYDVTEYSSFENAKVCFSEIMQECQPENQNVAFVGNKIDLEQRKVTYQQASSYCLQRQIYYVQTSALQNDYIKKIIEMIAKNLICSGKIKAQSSITCGKQTKQTKESLSLNSHDIKEAKKKGCFKKLAQGLMAFKRYLFD